MDLWNEVGHLLPVLKRNQDIEVLFSTTTIFQISVFGAFVFENLGILNLTVKKCLDVILLFLKVLLMPCFVRDHLDFETVSKLPL